MTRANKKMQRTKPGSDEASPLIFVLYGPRSLDRE